jgi:hypothetical protein
MQITTITNVMVSRREFQNVLHNGSDKPEVLRKSAIKLSMSRLTYLDATQATKEKVGHLQYVVSALTVDYEA